jgi:hypothetical protein
MENFGGSSNSPGLARIMHRRTELGGTNTV